mgnify:CR=1 FL=1
MARTPLSDDELIARFGRAVSKGSVACDANPTGCLQAFWKHYPDQKPKVGAEADILRVTTGDVEKGRALAEKTRVGAGELADAATKEAGALAERTRVGVGELATSATEQTVAAARVTAEWAGRQVARGELTETAKGWLRAGSELSREGIEAVLAKGQQAVPTALAIGGALATAVDSDTMLEPIYQPITQAAIGSAEADAAIRGMARVEPIEGLQVGFKELTSLDLGHRVSEQAYLVVWRQDEHLVGFVFRSRRDIKIAEVVALAPKLVALVRGVL